MNNKYREQNGDITYVLSFEPRKDTTAAFSGKVWIDSATNILTKVELSIRNSDKCPFIPIHRGGELRDVNMHITKTFDRTVEGVRLNSMDFDYDFTFDPKGYYGVETHYFYKEPPQDSIEYLPVPDFYIRAEAVLAAYNYQEEFYIPKFDFPADFADYRKMMAFGDHQQFWNCYNDFRVGKSEQKEAFLNDSRTVTQEGLYKPSHISDIGMYEFPYRMWSKKRVYMRPPKDTTEAIPMVQDGVTPNSQKYELVAQILFEIDDQCDSITYRAVTIFDPFQSYYKFERTPRSVAFHNVYFDLMEIARRELVAKLDAIENPTREIWTKIYEEHMEETRHKMELYFKEVDRGTKEEEFLKWNAIVVNTLGIDNNLLFSASEEE